MALANLRLREALRNQSIIDPLNGLVNRRYLEQTLERECRRSVRAGRPLSVIMLDVDHFKRFNDVWGHDGGDAVLKELAALLLRSFRGEDMACRFGGRSSSSLSPTRRRTVAHERAVSTAAYRWRNSRSGIGGQPMGAITYLSGRGSADHGVIAARTLLDAADRALYEAKHAGRDRGIVRARLDAEGALSA